MPQERNNPRHLNRLEAAVKVDRWQQCVFGQHPGLHDAGEGCDPSLLHWSDPSGSLGALLDFPVQKRHGNTGTSPVRGHSDA